MRETHRCPQPSLPPRRHSQDLPHLPHHPAAAPKRPISTPAAPHSRRCTRLRPPPSLLNSSEHHPPPHLSLLFHILVTTPSRETRWEFEHAGFAEHHRTLLRSRRSTFRWRHKRLPADGGANQCPDRFLLHPINAREFYAFSGLGRSGSWRLSRYSQQSRKPPRPSF